MNFHGFGGPADKEQLLSMLFHLQGQWLLIYNPFTVIPHFSYEMIQQLLGNLFQHHGAIHMQH